MARLFQKYGVRFEYPDGWTMTEDQSSDQVCITIANDETSFWSLTLFFDAPSPEDVTETVLQAFRDEYDSLDVYPEVVQVASQPAVGANLEFLALDLTNSAFVRVCRTDEFTAVVLYQGTDVELDETLDLLERISGSLEFETDDGWPDFASREDGDVEELEDEGAFAELDDDPEAGADDEPDDESDEDVDDDERWIPLR